MSFLIQQTLIYAVPLMIVALAGIFSERSGTINLALEGIMIFGAFIGVLFINLSQSAGMFAAAKAAGDWGALQGFMVVYLICTFTCSRLLRWWEKKLDGPASYDLATTDTLAHTSGMVNCPADPDRHFDERSREYNERGDR